jgi:TolB-like protein
MTNAHRWIGTAGAAALLLVAGGCSATMGPTRFVNPKFDFGFVEKLAVLPLDNLSDDPQAGERATRILVTELLATGAVDVVEPGELRAALDATRSNRTTPTADDIRALGQQLGVQALIVGSVAQSENLRQSTVTVPVVTIDLHMVEVETGATVWASTHTEKGAGVGAKLLGVGAEPISETTRRTVRVLVHNLVR